MIEMDGMLICCEMFILDRRSRLMVMICEVSPVGPLLRALYVQVDINIDNIYHLTAFPLLNLPKYLPSTSSI